MFNRRYLISFFYIIVCVIGLMVWNRIPVENTPDLNLPKVTVSYYWGGTPPEVMEQEITRSVEREAGRLRDVSEINSITKEGQSQVSITFMKEAPVDYRVLELREYLFSLEDKLPESVQPPSISRQVPEELEDQQTFVVYTLNGDRQPRELLEYAREHIKPRMLALEGLAETTIRGVRDPALVIAFRKDAVEKFGIEPREVLMQVRDKLSWRSAGYTDEGSRRYSLVIPPGYRNSTDIGRMKLEIAGSRRFIQLAEIAEISVEDYPARSLKRINGDPALTIEFVKESGADAFSLAREIGERMDEIDASLPEDMVLRQTLDSTEELREQFSDLQKQAMLSGVLVFVVVILFIRQFRAPLVIIGSVAFSVLLSIIILYTSGYSLNIITLAGLTIALGMLIDNAVVVFEHLNPGLPGNRQDRFVHIRKELKKAVVPVLGSTFTTVGIFVPLLFAMEELRIFLVPLAAALTITLLSSVIIAFSWIPYSLIWLTAEGNEIQKKSRRKKAARRTSLLLRSFIWKRRLKWLFIPLLIAAVGIPLFAVEEPDWEENTSWPEFTQVYFDYRDDIDFWIGGIPYRFFTETHFGDPWSRRQGESVYVNITAPQGTPLSEIDKIVRNFEKIATPYTHIFDWYEANMSESYGAYMVFRIKEEELVNAEPYQFFGETAFLGARTGNVAISVSSGLGDGIYTGFGSSSTNHSIKLTGYSYDELYDLAADLRRRLQENGRVKEVDINKSGYYSRGADFYQYKLRLDEESMMARKLDRRQVIQSIGLDLNPENTAGKVEFGGQEMYLMGQTAGGKMYAGDVLNRKRSFDKVRFNLDEIGSVEKEKALNEIRRNNQSYQRIVGVNYLGNYRMGREAIEEVLEKTPVPVGAEITFGRGFFSFGKDESNKNLIFVALLSLLSVWMIVSALLESVKFPLFVILAVPYSMLGIMLGVMITDISFDRGAIAGALLSIGVVVNNAILIYHQKQLEEAKGRNGLRGWIYVYRKRIRAILITTITTITGLLPMMLLGGDAFWENLAIVVISGLSLSTLLILLMTGVRFRVLARSGNSINN